VVAVERARDANFRRKIPWSGWSIRKSAVSIWAKRRVFFTDGQAYERLMGRWSRAAGEIFLQWLSLPKGLSWLDVGCGTGAFTELVIDRCAPSNITAIDPAEDQIAYARNQPAASRAMFRTGDAQLLPFADREFEVAANEPGSIRSTRTIEIEVSYPNFADYWSAQTGLANTVVQSTRKFSEPDVARLQAYLRNHLPTDHSGRIAYPARANAVKGRVPN
jgi:SAM-dependent methyltransferase